MTHRSHELADQFPEDREVLQRLKEQGGHFAVLAEKYRHVNDLVHRGEIGLEAHSDEYAEELKKERLTLLDEVAALIARERGVSA